MITTNELIPGIYNDCDAWCERCLFTNRCRSFQIQSKTGLVGPVSADGNVVQQLTEALNLTKQHIENLSNANELAGQDAPTGLYIDKLEEDVVADSGAGRTHPVSQWANDYLKQTGLWLTNERNLLEQAAKEQLRQVELGLQTEEDAMPLLYALKDAWEVIRWYRTLIPVKIQSVLRTLTDPTENSLLSTYYLGKAKLVLVSIDQSMLAWQTVLQHYPEKMDDLLDMLSLLSRLRREIDGLFPQARAFKRAGLD